MKLAFSMTALGPLAIAAIVALAGCAGPGAIPAQSTASTVRDTAGIPTDVRFDANGDEIWEYAQGPQGFYTYVVRMAVDGKVKSVNQVLAQENFDRIVAGKTTKQEVRALLGRPSDVHYLRSGTSWEWRVNLNPRYGYYVMKFDDRNVVAEKSIIYDTSGGGDKGSK